MDDDPRRVWSRWTKKRCSKSRRQSRQYLERSALALGASGRRIAATACTHRNRTNGARSVDTSRRTTRRRRSRVGRARVHWFSCYRRTRPGRSKNERNRMERRMEWPAGWVSEVDVAGTSESLSKRDNLRDHCRPISAPDQDSMPPARSLSRSPERD